MKQIMAVILLLFISISGWAKTGDYSIITDKNIATFIKIMPSYRAILKKYGEENSLASGAGGDVQAKKYYQELNALVRKFGLSIEDLFALINRVVSAYPLAKMKSQGVSYPILNNRVSLSAGEMNILLKYLPQLDKVLEGN